MTFLTETVWTSSLLILAVLALRAALGTRVSARLRYGLWLLPTLRLCIPVSVQQAMHLMPKSRLSVVELPRTAAMQAPAPVQPLLDNLRTGHVYTFDDPTPAQAAASIDWQLVLFVLWLAGIAAVTVWCVTVNHRFTKNLTASCEYRGISRESLPVYVAQNLRSPCLYALYGKPGIYVPRAVADNPERLRHVLAHEDAHFRQHDLIWSVVRIGLLALYWFHPLVWVMAFLSRRDCEQACDEAAIRMLGEDERLAYGRTLIGLMAAGRPGDLVCGATTMTDSKKGVRQRVRRIAERPQTRAAAVFLLAACVVLSVAFTFTGSTTHQKACAMLRQSPPVSAYYFAYLDGMQTYTALSRAEIEQAVELFLGIRNTEESPGTRAEDTPEWILDFTLPDGVGGETQHISMEITGANDMLVHFDQGGDQVAYFVHETDTILALRKLVGLPLVRMETISAEQGTFRLHNFDPDHAYIFDGLSYTLENQTTGEGRGISASQAEYREPKRIEPGASLDWTAPSWSIPSDGRYRLTTEVTRDDGEALEISTVFVVGEPDDSSASEAFYKGWPLVQGTRLTAAGLSALTEQYGASFDLRALDGFAYYAAGSDLDWQYYEMDDGGVVWGNLRDGRVTLTRYGRDSLWHETAPDSGRYDFLPMLTADDVRDIAERGDAVHTSEFDHFLWETPDNVSVDYMQFPVYDQQVFGSDTGLYLTMASGGSDTPSSVALYAPDGTLLLDDLRGCDPSALAGWLKAYLPKSEELSGKRTNDPNRFLFNFLNWPLLSSQFPVYVQASGSALGNDFIVSGMDWTSFVNNYVDSMRFCEDITERPQAVPTLQLNYSDNEHRMFLYAREKYFLIQRDSTWACYFAPEGFYDAVLQFVQASGEPYASFTDAEIEAAKQAARDYFSAEAASRKLTKLWYDDSWCQWMRLTYLQHGRGAENGVDPENVLVLLCDFTVDGDEHTYWSLIFIRDSAQGAWRLDDQGY